MKDILYRGKSTVTGRWVYGVPVPNKYYDDETKEWVLSDRVVIMDAYYEFHNGRVTHPHCFMIDPETVGQFTGLVDKNGRPIYEGDIIRGKFLSNRSRQKFKVIFKDGMFLFDNEVITVDSRDIYSLEVIGNIHDNPEWLKKKKV